MKNQRRFRKFCHLLNYGTILIYLFFTRLAVKYLFLANDGVTESTELHVEPFNANQEQNDYEVTNILSDVISFHIY